MTARRAARVNARRRARVSPTRIGETRRGDLGGAPCARVTASPTAYITACYAQFASARRRTDGRMFFELRSRPGGERRKKDTAARAMRSDTVRRKSHYFGIHSDIFMALCRHSLSSLSPLSFSLSFPLKRVLRALRAYIVPPIAVVNREKERGREKVSVVWFFFLNLFLRRVWAGAYASRRFS